MAGAGNRRGGLERLVAVLRGAGALELRIPCATGHSVPARALARGGRLTRSLVAARALGELSATPGSRWPTR
ncbi:hypothetical protein NN3_52950 [Nocardia neocaledoniensis NBRC 108232]|nr:hypothetical protein NN3_52950 [Nocardia neocaledoniensis NBRC 108232]